MSMNSRVFCIFAVGLLTISSPRFSLADNADEIGLPGADMNLVAHHGVSADGSTVVGGAYFFPTSLYQPFRWSRLGGTIALTDPLTDGSLAGMSADGSVVAGTMRNESSSPYEAYQWTRAEGLTEIGALPGTSDCEAGGISADGTTIVGFCRGSAHEAFRWSQATGMVGLGVLPGMDNSSAYAASADGSVVVGLSSLTGGDSAKAFRWTQATGMVDLGLLPGTTITYPFAIASDGSAVTGVSMVTQGRAPYRGFLWTPAAGIQELLGAPEGDGVYPTAISADGTTVVGTIGDIDGDTATQPFRWTAESGIVGLGVPLGAEHAYALAVSGDGSVVAGGSGSVAAQDDDGGFRWTEQDGIQSLADVLAAKGIDMSGSTAANVSSISADGSVLGFDALKSATLSKWRGSHLLSPPRAVPRNKSETDITVGAWVAQLSSPFLFYFPLDNVNASTVQTISLFDHSMRARKTNYKLNLSACDGIILAFTGDVADRQFGSDGDSCTNGPGYKKAGGAIFSLQGLTYIGGQDGPTILKSDHQTGYDYAASFGSNVYASVAGAVRYPKRIVGQTAPMNALELTPRADPSYRIYYFYLSTYPGLPAVPFPGTPQPGCYKHPNGREFTPATLPLQANTRVKGGCLIALSGYAQEQDSPRLHVEVQRVYYIEKVAIGARAPILRCLWNDPSHTCIPIDPYGWTGGATDCTESDPSKWSGDIYECLTGISSVNLWPDGNTIGGRRSVRDHLRH